MSKEMMIVFVYDTECLQHESDDPVSAVLYFHPSWVSDTQKFALVGQLMGTVHFLRSTFDAWPQVVSLQNGRFVLKEFGRYVLAVGTDRNLATSTLRHRAELLTSLVHFWHRDIETMRGQFAANGRSDDAPEAIESQRKSLSEKLYHVFETYLPILQHSGNIFHNMPISRLPKSASNIFLDAMQTLQSCQQTKGVLGGSIFYHNKVLATQLTPEITKNLILTDPYRIKSSAEALPANFHVPVGVQLLVVYVPLADHRKLQLDAQRAQTVGGNPSAHPSASQTPAGIVPFQFKKKIKRDKSLIFTNIPEEATIAEEAKESTLAETPPAAEEPAQAAAKPPAPTANANKVRPTHLPLRFKNITAKDLPESGFSSINFDESDSFPQFIGKTSVCSTPMTEMKVLHGAVLSLCADDLVAENPPAEQPAIVESTAMRPIETTSDARRIGQRSKQQPANASDRKTASKASKNPTANRRHSMNSIQNTLNVMFGIRSFGQSMARLGMRYRQQTPPGGRRSLGDHHSSYGDQSDDEFDIERDRDRRTYRTITDPMYPVFNHAGAPISKSLFDEFQLAQDSPSGDDASTAEASLLVDERTDPLHVEGFDGRLIGQPDDEPVPAKTPSSCRQALNLPLKSLNLDLNAASAAQADPSNASGQMFEAPAQRKKLAGIQLTPLMSKLSVLADERTSGFCSWDTTPGGAEGAAPTFASTPAACDAMRPFRRRSSTASVRHEDLVEFAEDEEEQLADAEEAPGNKQPASTEPERQRCELFVCGQQNITMMLVLDAGACERQELVQAMFDTCVSRLLRIETSLGQTMSANLDGDGGGSGEGGSSAYSFLCTDPHWDTLQRGGPWSAGDMLTLECMRSDLLQANDGKTDMIVRTDDGVVYGYQHGQSAVFYKQSATAKPGIPPPADVMGTVSVNAKRRLERDHSIVLL